MVTKEAIGKLAENIATIYVYAVHNPLFKTFEKEIPKDYLTKEYRENELYRIENGRRMYELIKSSILEYEDLSEEEKKTLFKSVKAKRDVIRRDFRQLLISLDASAQTEVCCYSLTPDNEGNIYVQIHKDDCVIRELAYSFET